MKWAFFAFGVLASLSTSPKYAHSDLEVVACIVIAAVCFAAAAAIEIADQRRRA